MRHVLPHRHPRWIDMFLLIIFCVAILYPGLGILVQAGDAAAEREQRTVADWPNTSTDTVYQRPWREQVTAYINDRFGWRASLVRLNNRIAVELFRTAPKLVPKLPATSVSLDRTPQPASQVQPPASQPALTPTPPPTNTATALTSPTTITGTTVPAWTERDVVVGSDGWFFLDQEGAIDDYRCRTPFTTDQLQRIIRNLRSIQAALADRKITFVMVIAPDKPAVYSEFLPKSIQRVGTTCRIDQVVEAVQQQTTIQLIDPRAKLLEKKKDTRVYHKTDSHWNAIGAFTTYRMMMQRLARSHPSLVPLDWTDFTEKQKTVAGLDLARLLSLEKTLKEQDLQLVPHETRHAVQSSVTFRDPNPSPVKNPGALEIPGSTLPRALMLRDSFAGAIIPYVAENFSRLATVWSYAPLPNILDAEHPDIVILEIAQRKLSELINVPLK